VLFLQVFPEIRHVADVDEAEVRKFFARSGGDTQANLTAALDLDHFDPALPMKKLSTNLFIKGSAIVS
jgi:hypothetical protein